MKQRVPDSFEHAITMIIAELGAEECGRIIGKSASLVRKASDPDQGFMLDLHQALLLDAAYQKRTGETPPIIQVFMRFISPPKHQPRSIVTGVLDLVKGVGECGDKVSQFTAATSADGEDLSNNEKCELLEKLDFIERSAANMKSNLKQATMKEA